MFQSDPYRPSTSFTPIIQLMRAVGAWWPENPSRLDMVYPLTGYFIMSLTTLGQVFYCWSIRHDFDALLNAVFLNMTYLALILKIRNWHRVFARVQELILYTCNTPSFIPTNDIELQFVRKAIAISHTFYVLIIFGSSFCVTFLMTTPLFTGSVRQLQLPMQSYYFIDTHTVGRYVAMYIWQILGFVMSAPINHTIDAVTVGLMTMATAQIQMLGDRQTKIGRSPEAGESVDAELRQCVIFYQRTVAFVGEIQQCFQSPLFVQFGCTSVIICATGYKLFQSVPGSLEFFTLSLYMAVMNLQLSVYCWISTELTFASDRLGQQAYGSDFPGFGALSLWRKLAMCMQMMQKPMCISAVGFFEIELSVRMYLTVVKTAYSNLMVLNEMNKD